MYHEATTADSLPYALLVPGEGPSICLGKLANR